MLLPVPVQALPLLCFHPIQTDHTLQRLGQEIDRLARIFGRSTQWVYWGMRTGVFTRADGTAIEPLRVGANGRRRFTIPVLQEMAHACHRRGILNEADLHVLLDALDREGG